MTRSLRAFLPVLSLLLASCGGGGGGSTTPTAPQVSLSTSALAAGTVAVNSSTPLKVILTNSGNAALSVSSISISGADSAAFSASNTCGMSVVAGGSCTITVTFAPTTAAAMTAMLNIASNAAGSPNIVSLSGTAASNALTVVVDSGPTSLTHGSANLLYATVTICTPGTSSCKAIDHIQVDTGSTGLRIFKSVVTSPVAPVPSTVGGQPVFECLQFADGYVTGAVVQVDVTLGSRTIHNLSIQVIDDVTPLTTPAPPPVGAQKCNVSSTGKPENSISLFQANGLLGVGNFLQDCGITCATVPTASTLYYTCPPSGCGGVAVPLAQQLPNPIAAFGAGNDNNGLVIEMPVAPQSGAASLSGNLYFGIGTQADNTPASSAQWFTLDPTYGIFTTNYNGTPLANSFVDSGSNGYFFDTTDPLLIACPMSGSSGFYCPMSPVNLSATIIGQNGASQSVAFTVTNADQQSGANSVLPGLAGTISSSPTAPHNAFDWGMPFFYGRKVYVLFEGESSPAAGPAIAF